MKTAKIKFLSILVLLCISLPIFAQEYVYVSVEKAEIKEGIGLFANKIAQVKYGTKLIVLENSIKDEWIKVCHTKDESICGWILSSNVTKKRIVRFLNNKSSAEKEQALAGKGSSIEKSNSDNNNFNSLKKLINLFYEE